MARAIGPKLRGMRRHVLPASIAATAVTVGAVAFTWVPRHSNETMTTVQLRHGLDNLDSCPHPNVYLMKAATISSMSIKKLAEIAKRDDELGQQARGYISKLKELVEGLR